MSGAEAGLPGAGVSSSPRGSRAARDTGPRVWGLWPGHSDVSREGTLGCAENRPAGRHIRRSSSLHQPEAALGLAPVPWEAGT